MNNLYNWYNDLSKQIKDSIIISATIIGIISTVLSILGISLGNLKGSSVWFRILLVIIFFLAICIFTYYIIGRIFKNSVRLTIRKTPIFIRCGDIFEAPEDRVIGCDTHFETRVDDKVISKRSLHGQLILEHSDENELLIAIENEAKRLGLQKNSEGTYDFPLGTIVRYHSSVDNHTYLMLAMTELNENYEAHTNMAKFEQMLMKMWREIDRVYASHDIVLPLLGSGISRFDDGPKENESLLGCMLCTLNSSGVTLNSKVSILIYGNVDDILLYEFKDIFHSIPRR